MTVRFRTAFSALALLLCLSITAWGAEETGAKLDEKEISLGKLLKMAGPLLKQKLIAAPSIADDRVVIAFETKTAEQFREALDKLPGYQWLKCTQEDGGLIHVLAPDRDERERWRALAEADREKWDTSRVAEAEKRLREYFDALNLTLEQLWALADEDPNLVEAVTEPFMREWVKYFAGLPRDQLLILLQTGLSGRFRDLPPAVKNDLIAGVRRLAVDLPDTIDGTEDDAERMAEEGMISFTWDHGLTYSYTVGSMQLNSTILLPRTYPAGSARTALRVHAGMSEEQAEAFRESDDDTWRQRSIEDLKALKQQRLRDAPPRFGSERLPHLKLQADTEAGTAYSVMREVCAGASLNMICQHFDPYQTYPTDPLEKGMSVADCMDSVTDWEMARVQHRGYVWAYSEGCVLLTSRRLAQDLDRQAPLSLVEKWRQWAKAHRDLSLDELAEIAASSLTDEQIKALPRDLQYAGCIGIHRWRDHLRFYAALSTDQRRSALSESGLACSALSAEQLAIFRSAALKGKEAGSTKMESFSIQPGKYELANFVYGFSDAGPVVFNSPYLMSGIEGRRLSDTPGGVPEKEEQEAPEDPLLRAALLLADWTYVDARARDDRLRATLRKEASGNSQVKALSIGDELGGARLQDITAKCLTFTVGKGQIMLPIGRSVALAPFRVRTR